MASRSMHVAAPLLLAVIVGLIVYVSLYPFRFEPHGPSLAQALHAITWMRSSRGDLFNNVLLYIPLGFSVALLCEPRFGRTAGIVSAVLLGAALSLCMELLQASIPNRVSSLNDVASNGAGSLIGAIAGSAWHLFGARMVPQDSPRGRSAGVAFTVIVLWLTARLWPLIPDPGLRQLKRAVRPLLTPHVRIVELVALFVGWLVVAQAAFHLSRKQRGLDLLLILIAAVLVGRAFSTGNTLVTAELAAIALSVPALMLLSRIPDAARSGIVAALVGGWLLWLAARPFMTGVATFSLHLPELGRFLSRTPPAPAQLAGKAFSYVALAWLLAGAGLLPHVAAGLTVLFVLGLTLLQLAAPSPLFGWVDLLLVVVAAVFVARWMPSSAPRATAPQRKR